MTQLLDNFAACGLALSRVAGMVAFAPVFSAQVLPRRVKLLIALAIGIGLVPSLPATPIHNNLPQLALAAAFEFAFGALLGLSAALVFTGVRCAGEIITQQLGLSLAQILDPMSGEETPLLGNFYFAFASVVFLVMNGHHAVIRVLGETFRAVPIGSVTFARPNVDLLTGLLHSATFLAVALTAPIVLTMVLVDLTLGMAARMVPQLNVMSLAVSVRAVVGIVLLLLAAVVTAKTLGTAMSGWMNNLSTTLGGG